MSTSEPPKITESPLTRDLLLAAKYYLGRRRSLIVLAGALLVAGLALNWSWLVAAGLAPIVLALAPCAAMCALGLCTNKAGGKSCSTGTGATDQAHPRTETPQAMEDESRAVEGISATTTPPEARRSISPVASDSNHSELLDKRRS
ncbi:MAG: hypothetical protein ACE5H8_08940 [Alphaproteobacteria bacterium]